MIGNDEKYGALKDIRTMQQLQLHKVRLQVSNSFLEERIGDNIKGIKHQLSPTHLLAAGLSRLAKRFETSTVEGEERSSMDMLLAIVKSFAQRYV